MTDSHAGASYSARHVVPAQLPCENVPFVERLRREAPIPEPREDRFAAAMSGSPPVILTFEHSSVAMRMRRRFPRTQDCFARQPLL